MGIFQTFSSNSSTTLPLSILWQPLFSLMMMVQKMTTGHNMMTGQNVMIGHNGMTRDNMMTGHNIMTGYNMM